MVIENNFDEDIHVGCGAEINGHKHLKHCDLSIEVENFIYW